MMPSVFNAAHWASPGEASAVKATKGRRIRVARRRMMVLNMRDVELIESGNLGEFVGECNMCVNFKNLLI
jgi:hypothetical protein